MEPAARTQFQRLDVLNTAESVEERAIGLLEQLRRGDITVADLMGPLSGIPDLTAHIPAFQGGKVAIPTAPAAKFLPADEHNQLLENNVRPANYINPEPDEAYDLVVIGAGVAGLITVIVAAWLGKKCALVEQHGMGGDCLNTGCVPSKALIACARAAHSVKSLRHFGVNIPDGPVTVDFGFVMQRMRAIRAQISHHDSVQRYSREFCKHVFVGCGKFIGDNKVEVVGSDGRTKVLSYNKAMIATGASATIPRVMRSNESNNFTLIPHLTNNNFFNLTELPPRLVVIGCGAVGLELAQAMARLGSQVVSIDAASRLMPKEDVDAAALLRQQLEDDGMYE
jgi:pyruvate/2-oxoglutarate dehydrogenase complex dihydrolipoamide dehydrogenase (E3) component